MKLLKSPRFWFYVRRALWILLAWTLISNVLFFYDLITLTSNDALDSNYDFMANFTANLVGGISGALVGGLFTVNIMEYCLRRFAFWKAVVIILILYTCTACLVGGFASAMLESQNLELPFWHPEVIEDAVLVFTEWLFIKNFIIWLFIVFSTLAVLMINDKYGPGVFPDYLKGKYFQPKRERRIFMFADIKNATGIAESLGEEKYFHLLKDFFKDISAAILETRGEVYQYVGDEVVISWKMKQGLKNSNAIQCYYRMKELIQKKADKYTEKYTVVPDFKVGYHFGWVMVGELGQIKRDIAFSGDVLNTAARIQAKCNELNVGILASEDFSKILPSLPEGIERASLGKHELKGKASETSLITFRNKN